MIPAVFVKNQNPFMSAGMSKRRTKELGNEELIVKEKEDAVWQVCKRPIYVYVRWEIREFYWYA